MPRLPAALALASFLALIPPVAPAAPTETAPRPLGLAAFVAAYPEHLAGVEGEDLVWRDGTRMSFADLGIRDATGSNVLAADAVGAPHQRAAETISAIDYAPIFAKMYGDCRLGEVERRLAPVRWNRGAADGGRVVLATAVNGVAEKLQRVSDELDALGPDFAAYLRPLGGTYVCRNIALTNRLSLHGYGIAVDINPAHGDYWLTARADEAGERIRRNRIPMEIVAAFERHGFVWGGRWHRFDTFHFEYRPEYFAAIGDALPERLTSAAFTAFFGGRTTRATEGAPARFAGFGRMSYAPRPANAAPCFRWVRQPGPRFGQCLERRPAPTRAATR